MLAGASEEFESEVFGGWSGSDATDEDAFLPFDLARGVGRGVDLRPVRVKPLEAVVEALQRTGGVEQLDLHLEEFAGNLVDSNDADAPIEAGVSDDAFVVYHLELTDGRGALHGVDSGGAGREEAGGGDAGEPVVWLAGWRVHLSLAWVTIKGVCVLMALT